MDVVLVLGLVTAGVALFALVACWSVRRQRRAAHDKSLDQGIRGKAESISKGQIAEVEPQALPKPFTVGLGVGPSTEQVSSGRISRLVVRSSRV